MSGVFLLMGILVGALAGMRPSRIADGFVDGFREIAMGALVVGFAYGILIVLKDASILDTILHYLESLLGNLPAALTAISMFMVQLLLNFLVPSGSGQAALTMPLMVPLSDLMGVTRQTAVLAFQFGDGISNIITPTSGYFMAGLARGGGVVEQVDPVATAPGHHPDPTGEWHDHRRPSHLLDLKERCS